MLRTAAFLSVVLAVVLLQLRGNDAFQRRSTPADGLLRTVKMRLYGRTLDKHFEYLMHSKADKMLESPFFDPSKPTVFYFHGYTETPESESVRTVISAFLGLRRYNAVVVDWSQIAAMFYVVPQVLCRDVGRLVARQLDAWHAAGRLAIPDVYLVGHSLGGQAAGFTGKHVTKGKIPRITALDPAFPGFSVAAYTQGHLSASDAHFVDVIHTDGGRYGAPYATGHADFYPNGGKRLQPGCPSRARFLSDEDFCSHWRSWRFFAESLDSSLPPYYGLACESHEKFVSGRCEDNERVVMGFYAPTSARGTFYLETTDAAPFSKAAAGLRSTLKKSSNAATKRRVSPPRKGLLWFLG